MKFPGIGSRQATRFAFHLLRQPDEQFRNFINELSKLKNEVKICQNCFFVFDSLDTLGINKNGGSEKICSICKDAERNQNIICIVEKESDVIAIEKTGHFNGVYHILGANIYAMQDQKTEDFILNNLKNRLKKLDNKEPVELLFALNPTPDSDATASFIIRNLSDLNVKITRLARGLPRGADVEYADQETLGHAIQNRN